MSVRSAAFIDAVRALARVSDEPIECEHYKGGGVRFNGFRQVRGATFLETLAAFEKRAKFSTSNHALSIDCYDDIDPVPLVPCEIGDLPSGGRYREARPAIVKGSVKVRAYTVRTITSEELKRVRMVSGVIDVVLADGELKCMTVDSSSMAVVGGLHDQLSSKNMKATHRTRARRKINYRRSDSRYKPPLL